MLAANLKDTLMDKKDALIYKLLEKIKVEHTDSINYLIPNFISKKLIDYNSIRNDLEHVISATKILIAKKNDKNKNPVIIACIWHSIIITYGKCFTDASNGQRTKLEIDTILKDDNELKDIHKKLMDLRHNFIAHRGDNANDISIAFLKIPKNSEVNFETSHYKIKSLRSYSPSISNLQNYLLLFDKVIREVEHKLQKKGEKTHKGFLNLVKMIPLVPKYTLIK